MYRNPSESNCYAGEMVDETTPVNADDLARMIMSSRPDDPSTTIRCQHWSEELGRFGGWHHHAGPHACDLGNHGGNCPWWARYGES